MSDRSLPPLINSLENNVVSTDVLGFLCVLGLSVPSESFLPYQFDPKVPTDPRPVRRFP